jgi:membrane protease subunit (stomatin/prohibitin family)
MGALLRGAALTVLGMVASYAMKRIMAKAQKQAEAAQQQAETTREQHARKELKTLKQDPNTGVYYAED